MPRSPELTAFENTPEWFTKTREKGLANILAFSDDQVFFGDDLNDISQVINTSKIQCIHLFGENAELRIWRTPSGLEELWLDDSGWDQEDVEDENYLLWNTEEQGLDHVRLEKFSKIVVRHYIRYDDQGQAYFSHSRLVKLA